MLLSPYAYPLRSPVSTEPKQLQCQELMWMQPCIRSGSLSEFTRGLNSSGEWNKSSPDKAHTLPWMSQTLSSGMPAGRPQPSTHQLTLFTWHIIANLMLQICSSSLGTCVFLPTGECQAHCFSNLEVIDLSLSPLALPLWRYVLSNCWMERTSEIFISDTGSGGPSMVLCLLYLPREGIYHEARRELTPLAISFCFRLIDFYISKALTSSLGDFHWKNRKPWDTHRLHSRNFWVNHYNTSSNVETVKC